MEYERRIKTLESLLNEQTAAQTQIRQQPLEPADQTVPLSTWVNNLRSQVDSYPLNAPLDLDLDYFYDGDLEPLPIQTSDIPSLSNNFEGSSSNDAIGPSLPSLGGFEPFPTQMGELTAVSTNFANISLPALDNFEPLPTQMGGARSASNSSGETPLSGRDNFAPSLIHKDNSASASNASGQTSISGLGDFAPSADFQLDAIILQDPFFQPKASLENTSPENTVTPYKCDAFLPPPELGCQLLKEYLIDSNNNFPLYQPYAIATHLRICYEGGSDGSSVAWASVYVVFGLAHRLRGMSAVTTPEDDQVADWYLCKILPTISSLLVSEPTFELVQCLLGLAMLIRSSRHYAPHGLYVSTALRIAQSLISGEQDDTAQQKEGMDIDHQKRILWLAFIMDTEESVFTNLPTTHRRGDLPSSCPCEDPNGALGIVTAAEGSLKINMFALRIKLVLIQADAIEEVFSMRSHRATPQEIVAKATQILQRLEGWRDNEVGRRTPEQLMQLFYRSDLLHALGMEGSHFATVFRVQAFLALGMDPRMNPFSAANLTRVSAIKHQACHREAERFLGILSTLPHEEIGICWYVFPLFTHHNLVPPLSREKQLTR